MLVMPSLHSVFMFLPSGEWIVEGCPEAYRNADNLVLQGFRTLCREAGAEALTVRLTINAGVPASRAGSGVPRPASPQARPLRTPSSGIPSRRTASFRSVRGFQGHPDNAAPCVLGGLTASFAAGERFHALPLPIAPDWRFATVIPNYEVKTSEARKAMPKEISVKDSVFTTSHAIAMINALASGAAAFFITGSGSTLIAMTKSDETALRFIAAARDRFPGFDAHVLETCREGVEVKVDQQRRRAAIGPLP